MPYSLPRKMALALCSVAVAASPAIASTGATVGIGFSQSFPNNSDITYIDDHDPLMTTTVSEASATLGSQGYSSSVNVSASAFATNGRLGVSAFGITDVRAAEFDSNGNRNGRGGSWAEANATARWQDRLTFSSPGLFGQHGTFDAVLRLSGYANIASNGGYAAIVEKEGGGVFYMSNDGRAYLSVVGSGLDWNTQPWDDACGGARLACANYSAQYPEQSFEKGNANVDLPVTIGFTYGLPVDIAYVISAYSYATSGIQYYKIDGGGSVAASADMSHTLLWGGMGNVYDPQGNILANYELSSTSGFDYQNAAVVPLPAGAWLFLSGLAGLATLLKKQKSDASHKTL